ncbi:MAG: hypothetical protein ABR988_03680 [Terriglobales bacterium]
MLTLLTTVIANFAEFQRIFVRADLNQIRQQGTLSWWVRGSAFIVFAIGWVERRDFWPVMAAGLCCTVLSLVVDDRYNNRSVAINVRSDWNWPFWTVTALSTPTLAAVVIMASALVWGPTDWVWVLPILLYFYIPVALVLSAIVAGLTQHSMRPERRRKTWQALALALSAVPLTLVLLWLASQRAESSLRH